MFEGVVFLACRRADPEGPLGPGSMAGLAYTLEGVSYTFRIADPAAEPPFAVDEVWFYLRFSRTTAKGFRRLFAMRILAVNDDGTRTPIPYPANAPATRRFPLGEIRFPTSSPVISLTTVLRDVEFPSRGRYEFRLLVERRRSSWTRSKWGWVSSHYIAVE